MTTVSNLSIEPKYAHLVHSKVFEGTHWTILYKLNYMEWPAIKMCRMYLWAVSKQHNQDWSSIITWNTVKSHVVYVLNDQDVGLYISTTAELELSHLVQNNHWTGSSQGPGKEAVVMYRLWSPQRLIIYDLQMKLDWWIYCTMELGGYCCCCSCKMPVIAAAFVPIKYPIQCYVMVG